MFRNANGGNAMDSFILKQDGAEVKRGDEQDILHYMHKSLGISPQICAITSISLKRILADAGRRTAFHDNDDLSAPFGIELSLEGWLDANKMVREITTDRQKANGDARMFVVNPQKGGWDGNGRLMSDADGRVVWFNRSKEDGTRTLRQFSIRHLNSDDTVRWPTGSISRTRPVKGDAGQMPSLTILRATRRRMGRSCSAA